MPGRRAIIAVALPAVLAIGLGLSLAFRPPRVGVSLLGLIGREAERMPAFMRETSERAIDVVVSSANREAAEAVAAQIRGAFKTLAAIPPGAVDFLRRERSGLVSSEVASLLETPEGRAKLARRAYRRLYANPAPPLLGFADDPFFLTESFLSTLVPQASVITTNGVTHALVRLDAAAGGMSAVDAFARPGVMVRLCGARVHSARAEARCRREVNILTLISLAFIGLLAFFVFRSVRWIPYLMGSLMVAALAGALVLIATFREIHLMSLVFGTTVLGLVVDYSFHWLLADSAHIKETRRSLTVSFLTTEISLVPLMVSSVSVLAQSAIFLGAGLAGALVYVRLAYPRLHAVAPRSAASPTLPRIGVRVLGVILVLAALGGLTRLTVKTDVTSLYRLPEDLLAVERIKAAFTTFDWSILPSCAVRARTSANVRALYAEQAAEMARTLSLPGLEPPPEPQFDFVPPRHLLDRMLAGWTQEAIVRFCVAMFCMLMAVVLLCGRKAMRIFAPPVCALLVVAGLLSLGGVTLNLFHLLAGFLLAGMGVDYAVFLSSETPSVRSVVCSLLTSVVGFGALAFVSMPVAASFGQTLGLGLPVAFVFALAFRRDSRKKQVEQAASPLGLTVLWLVYRVFGLHLLHFFARCVALCAWGFSSAIRRASPSPVKVMNFAVTLADRLAIMSGGRSVPEVFAEDHPDACAFIDDVQGGRGVFVLFSHVGLIEALVMLGACDRMFHAWMDVDRTSVFSRFYLQRMHLPRVTIHAITEFDMGAVFATGDWLDAGECVLMAGDRGDGAFRLATSFDHPIYFVACVYVGSCRYRVVARRLPSARGELKAAFMRCRDEVAAFCPNQSYTFAQEF